MLLLGERRRWGGECVGLPGSRRRERGRKKTCSLDIPRLGNIAESERREEDCGFNALKSYKKKVKSAKKGGNGGCLVRSEWGKFCGECGEEANAGKELRTM